MAHQDNSSDTAVAEHSSARAAAGDDAAGRFIGQWNRLVSTTNWEKGRIICEWREALQAAGAAVTDYSDEAWSQLVGRVTSQHVGRLRRVHQRFGAAFDQYQGLFWSHFQAAIDWEDAEMWLEGAIHNGWSVSQMRGKRWETVGKPGETMPADAEEAAGDDEDAPWLGEDESEMASREDALTGETAEVKSPEGAPKRKTAESEDDAEEGEEAESHARSTSSDDESPQATKKARSRLGVEVGDLPDDIADAFEQFKLAIITQRRLEWAECTPDSVIDCLDALRQLTLAPMDA